MIAIVAKYRYFQGRAAWHVVGHGKCKAGIVKHGGSKFCFDVAYSRYRTQRYYPHAKDAEILFITWV